MDQSMVEAIAVVSTASIVFMGVSLALALLFPIALAIALYVRRKCSPWAFMVGAAMMALSQFVIRIPLLRAASVTGWFRTLTVNPIAYGVFLGLTAGLFEGAGRFLGFSVFLKNRLEWKNAIAYGIGHGGIESILLVGIPYVNNIVFSLMINGGTFQSQVAPALPPGTADYLRSTLINTPASTFLLGGLERVLTMAVQIALSLLVFQGVTSRRFRYVIYAVLLHGLLDAPLVLITQRIRNPWIVELWVLLAAVVSVVYIGRSRLNYEGQSGEE